MSTRTYSIVFSGAATVRLPAGVFFLVKSASSPLSIETQGTPGAPVRFESIGAGLSYGPVGPGSKWTYLDVTSAAAQTVEIIVSEEAEVKVGSVVSVSGSVTQVALPSSSVATPAAVTVASGAAGSIAANGARRRIRIAADEANAGPIFVQATGAGAARGLPIAGGMWETFETTAALDVRNDTGADATYYIFEET